MTDTDGEAPSPAGARIWRRRLVSAFLAAMAVGAVLLAARVRGNARLLARIEEEAGHAVAAEREALAAGDEALWAALQLRPRAAAARRRFSAGPVGPLPGLRPATGPYEAVEIQADVDTARERGGRIESVTVRGMLAMEAVHAEDGALPGGSAGTFVEQSTWRRSRDGGWRRAPFVAESLSEWPEALPLAEDLPIAVASSLEGESPPAGSSTSGGRDPAALRGSLAQQLASLRDERRAGREGPLPRLRTDHLELVFLPADAAHAADLAARLDAFLARRCALLERDGGRGCRPFVVSLTLETPGAAQVAPEAELRVAAPGAGWAPVDESARVAYAEAILHLLLRGNARAPSTLESALVAQLFGRLGAGHGLAVQADAPAGPRPDLWTLWRHLRPGVDALGERPTLSPPQRASAAADGVTHARTMELARFLHQRVGHEATEGLVRALDEAVGSRWLLDWLRPVLREDALPAALAWSGAPPRWLGPPRLLRCDANADPLLLHEGLELPLDLRSTMCPVGSLAADAALSPGGAAVAVACRGARRDGRRAQIKVLRLDGPGAPNPEYALTVAEQTPFGCCLHWRGEEDLIWNAAPSTDGLGRIVWVGAPIRPGSAWEPATVSALAVWAPGRIGRLLPPFRSSSPDGALALLQGARDIRDWLAVFDAPAMPEAPSDRMLTKESEEPRWEALGDQPRWSPDGQRLAWLTDGVGAPRLDAMGSRRVSVVQAADGVAGASIGLGELLAAVGADPIDAKTEHVLARLAGWSRDGRLGVAIHRGTPGDSRAPRESELWLLTWDPLGRRDLEARVERGVALPALTDSWTATMAPGPLPAALHAFAPRELNDGLWRWPLGRLWLDERIVHLRSRPDGEREGANPTGSGTQRAGEAWRFGEDGVWLSVPAATLGISPAGRWELDPAGLKLVDDETDEETWGLPGPACVPERAHEAVTGVAP